MFKICNKHLPYQVIVTSKICPTKIFGCTVYWNVFVELAQTTECFLFFNFSYVDTRLQSLPLKRHSGNKKDLDKFQQIIDWHGLRSKAIDEKI